MNKTFNIAISLIKNDYAEFELRPPINMISGDHGTNVLKFTVYDDGEPVNLTGMIAKITCKCPSGTHQQQDLTMSLPLQGKMEVVLEQRFFSEGGTYEAEVQLYDARDLKVRASLPRFTYNVDVSLLAEGSVVSNEQFSILQQMVDTVSSAEARSIEALDTATRAMGVANQKGDVATEQAVVAKNEADRSKREADRAWQADFAKHITLEGENQTNFDCIRSKVVDDGLINFFEGLYLENVSKTISVGNVADFTVQMKFSLDKVINTRVLSFGDSFALAISNTNISIFDVSVVASIDYKKNPLELSFTKTGNNALLTVNGVSVSSVLKSNYSVSSIVINSGVNREKMNIDYIAIYNRVMDPQEIQHNFQVLNNSPSISEITITNADGSKSPYKLASDSEHVVMRSGYNAEECLTGVYDMCKEEFVSPNGAPIEIANALDKSKLLAAEIKGRTLKVISTGTMTVQASGGVIVGDTIVVDSTESPTTGGLLFALGDSCVSGTKYTLCYEVLSNTNYTGEFLLDSVPNYPPTGYNKLTSSVGIHYHTFTAKDHTTKAIKISTTAQQGKGRIVISKNAYLIEGEITDGIADTKSALPFGLSSTQAIIENNGQQYPIYEPIIKGETVVKDSTLVSLLPKDESLPPLGSVPIIADTLNPATGILTKNTRYKEYTGDEEWLVAVSSETHISFKTFNTGCTLNKDYVNAYYNIISNTLKTLPLRLVNESAWLSEGISTHNSTDVINICLPKTKLSSPNLEGFKHYLKTQHDAGTPITVCYQVSTPMIVQLTSEQVKAYDIHREVIMLHGIGEVRDTLTINDNNDAVWTKLITKIIVDGSNDELIRMFSPPLGLIVDGTKGTLGYKDSDTNKKFIDSDQFEGIPWNNAPKNNAVYLHPNGATFIRFDGTEKTLEQVKNDFKTNPVNIIGVLATPIVTIIPKELVSAVALSSETNEVKVASPVKPSSLKVSAPLNKILTMDQRLKVLEATINTPSNLVISHNYVEDVYKQNQQIESEMKLW